MTFAVQAEALRLSIQSEAVARWAGAPHAAKKIDEGAFEFVCDEEQETVAFLGWASKWARAYTGAGEFAKRLRNFRANNRMIKEANDAAIAGGKANAAMLDHNHLSDLSEREIATRLGKRTLSTEEKTAALKQAEEDPEEDDESKEWFWQWLFGGRDDDEEEGGDGDEEECDWDDEEGGEGDGGEGEGDATDGDDGGDEGSDSTHTGTTTGVDSSATYGTLRGESADGGSYDWSWATVPVMDQGSCGSCWAFTVNTTIEGTDLVFQGGDDSEKVRKNLSMQYPVSCAKNGLNGCNGGDGIPAFQFYKKHGTVDRADYPYASGATGASGRCEV